MSNLTTALPSYIVSAAVEAGLPTSSVVAFVTAVAKGNAKAAALVPGVNAAILGAAGQATKDAYAYSYRYIVNLVLTAFGPWQSFPNTGIPCSGSTSHPLSLSPSSAASEERE